MRIGVVGSRDFVALHKVDEYLSALRASAMGNDEPEAVVSGGARGVDQRAEDWAMRKGVVLVSFRPKPATTHAFHIERWTYTPSPEGPGPEIVRLPGLYPTFRAAAFVRNGFIVEFSDQVAAFWDGHSKGTADSISKARAEDKLRDIIHG